MSVSKIARQTLERDNFWHFLEILILLQNLLLSDLYILVDIVKMNDIIYISNESKSLNNYVALEDEPDEMFGKIMSISDELMWRYFALLSFKPSNEIENLKKAFL